MLMLGRCILYSIDVMYVCNDGFVSKCTQQNEEEEEKKNWKIYLCTAPAKETYCSICRYLYYHIIIPKMNENEIKTTNGNGVNTVE